MRNVMKISARTDYALRVLLELASDTSVPMTCEGIADTQQIPYRFLKSVVGDLRRAGLVASQRGCDGGYWLARNAANISVAEVVEAVDGSVLTVRGELVDRLGYQGTAEPLDALWGALQSYVDALFATTIAQLGAGRLAAGVPGRARARAQVAAVS
jgi:Rrf2 family protein